MATEPPRRRPRLRDVALRSGVSVSVVSRALNRDPALRARAATVERILKAADDVGYRPNAAARTLRTRQVGVLGIILPDVNNPFFSQLLSGIEEACDAAGVVPLIGRAERLAENPHLMRDLVNEGRVEGFLVQPTDTFPIDAFHELAADGVPHTFLVTRPTGSGSSVILDDERGIELAAQHVIELGHRRLGYAGGLPQHGTSRGRRDAFEAVLAGAGIEVRPEWQTALGYTFEDGRAALRQLASLPERPTALVVATHNSALGVLYEARALGIDVPSELSVVALHDSPSSERSWPQLTGVRMPLRQLGVRAVELLVDSIRTRAPRHERITDPAPELIVRGSTTQAIEGEPQ